MTGPTFHARFADGVETKLSVFTSLTRLDLQRGVALSRAAYEARTKHQKEPPLIVAARFEQEGAVLKTYSAEELAKGGEKIEEEPPGKRVSRKIQKEAI